MRKDFKFTLRSNFAMFHWETFKHDSKVSNNFISRTEVMGILGAILGLDGYEQINLALRGEDLFTGKKRKFNNIDTSTSYWVRLEGIEIAVVPKKIPQRVLDSLVHKDTRRINGNGNLMMQLYLLGQTEYDIYIKGESIQEDEMYEKLYYYLENQLAEFIPYMGQNSYPCVIEEFEVVELVDAAHRYEAGEMHQVKSVFPLNRVHDVNQILLGNSEILEWAELNETYTFKEAVKVGYDEEMRIVREDAVWTNKAFYSEDLTDCYILKNKEEKEVLFFYK